MWVAGLVGFSILAVGFTFGFFAASWLAASRKREVPE